MIGTLGGYIAIYDIRYSVVSSYYKHITRAPINSIACFHPSRTNPTAPYTINRCQYNSPMALISSGSSNYEVSLLNLATSDVEVLLTVDDSKNRENVGGSIPSVPSYLQEKIIDDSGIAPKKHETNQSIFRRYIQSNWTS